MEKNFYLSPQAFQAIVAGLNELPAKIANPILNDLQQQADELNEKMKKATSPT